MQGKHQLNRHAFTDYHSVHHVRIPNQSAVASCPIFFPNAHELTIADNNHISGDSLTIALNRIIPLEHLHKITIKCTGFPLHTLLEILYLTSNCYKLTLESLLVKKADLQTIQHDQRFQLASNVNKTADLVVKSIYTLEQIKILTVLCPKLHHLKIKVAHEEFASIIKYLLSKSNKYTRHLASLHIQSTADIYIEKLTNLLQPLKRSNEFTVQEINYKTCYIWW